MRLLALDPGMTTGYAVFQIVQDTIFVEAVGDTEWDKSRENGPLLPKKWWPPSDNKVDIVVIEYVVPVGIGKHSQVLATINSMLKTVYPNAVWVRSGQWKPVTGSWPLDNWVLPSFKLSRHAKDALRIGLFELRKTYPILPSRSYRPDAEAALPHAESAETT